MTTEMIKKQYQELEEELKSALSTMEYSHRIREIREEIFHLQHVCPHKYEDGTFAFNETHRCLFCGKVMP